MKQKTKKSGKKITVKRKILILIIGILILLAGTGGILFYIKNKASDTTTYELTAGKGEELLTGTITSIIGNEMTMTVEDDTTGDRNYTIPVGTEVITRLGTSTTFSRLSTGNSIEMLLEEGTDNILKIHIV